jgi:hypothetical protein
MIIAMKTRSIYSFIAVVLVLAATALSTGVLMKAQAQNTTSTQPQTADPTQIKSYLTGAIQALDNGNNTMALGQLELAEDKLSAMTGTTANDDADEGDEEDEDEAGDVDTNDEEDSP